MEEQRRPSLNIHFMDWEGHKQLLNKFLFRKSIFIFLATDVIIDKGTPIFATMKNTIKYNGKFNTSDEREQAMMDAWQKIIKTEASVPKKSEQKHVPNCGRRLSELTLMGEM